MYVHKYIHVGVYRRETLVDLVRHKHHHKLLLLHVSVDMSTDTSTLNPISREDYRLHYFCFLLVPAPKCSASSGRPKISAARHIVCVLAVVRVVMTTPWR